MKMYLHLFKCPKCGAEENKPCVTPKGKEISKVHDTRQFAIASAKPKV